MAGKAKKVDGTKETFEFVDNDVAKLHVKPIKCLNERQKELIKSIEDKEVTIVTGLAGCGKTYMALWKALKLLEKRQIEKIVLVKSVTTLKGEDLGFLPGDVSEKMQPFLMSFYGNIDKLIGESTRIKLVEAGKIEIQPLAYVRGINIDRACVILDEAQNITLSILKSIITRIGQDSRYCIMGDVEQIDMVHKDQSVLSKIVKIFEDDDKVGVVKFNENDCVRNPIIPHLLDKIKILEDLEAKTKEQKKSEKEPKKPTIDPQLNILNESLAIQK